MAGTSFFLLLDDIATLLDDVSAMSKVAIHKTAGVLGDDLALNANQVTGFNADRELPVVWRIALGSGVNKLILIPSAMVLSVALPWAIMPLLMLGGLYLCYEGVEKLVHAWLHPKGDLHEERRQAIQDPDVDMVDFEKTRITGAIRTDFVLSAEIIVITLGLIRDEPFLVRLGVLSAVGLIMTIGVYGLVAAIVKIDDLGLYWSRRAGAKLYDRCLKRCGEGLLFLAPWILRFLSVAGTAAMFLVGGHIMTDSVASLHHIREQVAEFLESIPWAGSWLAFLGPHLFDAGFGILAGALTVAVVLLIKSLYYGGKPQAKAPSSADH